MSSLVELSIEETLQRMFILKVLFIAKKLEEENILSEFTVNELSILNDRIEFEVKKIIDGYQEEYYDLITDSIFIESAVGYLYDEIYTRGRLEVEDVFEMLTQNNGFSKVGVVYYSEDKVDESMWYVDRIIENFYDSESDEYKMIHGDEYIKKRLRYYTGSSYNMLEVKDSVIMNYIKKGDINTQKELMIKTYLSVIVNLLDDNYVVIAWKIKENSIELIFKHEVEKYESRELDEILETNMRDIIKNIIVKRRMERFIKKS